MKQVEITRLLLSRRLVGRSFLTGQFALDQPAPKPKHDEGEKIPEKGTGVLLGSGTVTGQSISTTV